MVGKIFRVLMDTVMLPFTMICDAIDIIFAYHPIVASFIKFALSIVVVIALGIFFENVTKKD